MRLAGAGGVLVVATALLLSAAPGAYAPTGQVDLALTTGDLVGRFQDLASRNGERPVEAVPTEPSPATSSAAGRTPSPEADPTVPPAPPADASPAAPSPEPQAAARPAAAPGGEGAAMSAEIVALGNAERAAAGLPTLAVSSCATGQAEERAGLLVAEGRFEHDPLGPVLEQCAAGTVGENLSLGYRSAQAAVEGWMSSPGHRENLLRPAFTQIGVACVTGQRGWLCAQVFLG